MQRLVWQNSNGNEINLTSGKYGITNWEGFSNTSLNIQSQQVPFQDGGVFLDALMVQRELSVTLAMNDGNDLEKRYRMKRELIHALNPKLGEGYLIYTNNFISKRIKCVAQIPLFETHNSNNSGTPKASLSWTACEPYWEDLEETEILLQNEIVNQLENKGDVSINLEINIQGSNYKNPQIINYNNEKGISVIGNMINRNIAINTNVGKKSVIANEEGITTLIGGGVTGVATNLKNIVCSGFSILQKKYIGVDYTTVDLPNNIKTNDIIYAINKFYAISDKKIFSSSDGITWENIYTWTQSGTLKYIIFANNIFLAVGDNIALQSSDGTNWTVNSLMSYNISYVTSIKYLNNMFIVTTGSANIYTSTNASEWVLTDYLHSVDGNANDIEYGNGYYICCYIGNKIYKSTDLQNWETYETNVNKEIISIAFSNGDFILVGRDGCILTTLDGENITEIPQINNDNYIKCKILFNIAYICGEFGSLITSQDFVNWEVIRPVFSNVIASLEYANNILFGTSLMNNKIVYSLNKKDFYFSNFESSNIISDGNRVLSIKNNKIYECSNGLDWSQIQTNGIIPDSTYNIISFVNNRYFLSVSKSGVHYICQSLDCINWTYNIVAKLIKKVIYNGTSYITITNDNYTGFSDNGINWNFSQNNIDNALNYECINNLYIAISGNNRHVYYSQNAIKWNDVIPELIDNIRAVNNVFYATTNGKIYKSVNAVDWTYYEMSVELELWGICNDNNIIYFSGYNNNSSDDIAFILKTYIKESINYINNLSADSNINFALEVGTNNILFTCENGSASTVLKYRQKYIGV